MLRPTQPDCFGYNRPVCLAQGMICYNSETSGEDARERTRETDSKREEGEGGTKTGKT